MQYFNVLNRGEEGQQKPLLYIDKAAFRDEEWVGQPVILLVTPELSEVKALSAHIGTHCCPHTFPRAPHCCHIRAKRQNQSLGREYKNITILQQSIKEGSLISTDESYVDFSDL